ncbi:DUF4405 domain-containing protein [Thermovibrio sp.]
MLRKFVSLFLFYSLLFMTVTGIVLFVMPHGRVAYWSGWRFLGLDKDQWDNLHVIFGFLMLFFGFWHLTLNWRSFVGYLKSARKSFISATALALVVAVGAVLDLPPFKNFIELGEKFKNSWEKPKTMPPVPHAELLPLSRVASLLKMSPNEAASILNSKGIRVSSPSETLKEIARKNGTTPARIYEILLESSKGKGTLRSSSLVGSGLGMKSLSEVCNGLGIPVKVCLERLKRAGIEATSSQTLREIAFKNDKYPYQIVQIISGGKDE